MTRWIGAAAAVIYVGAIVAANWLITRFGIVTVLGLSAPAGVFAAALTFPARDIVQRGLGRVAGIGLIVAGAGLSWLISPTLAVASGVTFLVSEGLDCVLYSWLARRWFATGVMVSSVIAAVVDSLLFLRLAGIPYQVALAGQITIKLAVIFAVAGPVTAVLRRKLPAAEPAAAHP